MGNDNTEDITTEQVRVIPNPEGKGGFKDHPELINAGGRPKNQESFTYWLNYFKNISVQEFLDYEKNKPDDKRSVAESLAYARVSKARNELREFQEVANRTEGMPTQRIQTNITTDPDMKDFAVEVREEIEQARQLEKTNKGS